MRLLDIEGLKVAFPTSGSMVEVVRGVDLEIGQGEIVGLLGESGSGKSVTAAAVSLLSRDDQALIKANKLEFMEQDLQNANETMLRKIRGKQIAYVFQNPTESLSPMKKIGAQLAEVFQVHRETYTKQMIYDLIYDVGLSDPELICNMYPHQLSGGQAQRVMVAMAVALRPDLLIADEPTSSIDASLKDVVIDLLISVNRKYKTAILVITHDFDVAYKMCQRIYIMYGGLVLEEGPTQALFDQPKHPYTQALIQCVTSLHEGHGKLFTLEGTALDPSDFRLACPFYERCSLRQAACSLDIPKMRQIGERSHRCILADPVMEV